MTGCMVAGNMFSAFAADVFTKTTGSGSVTTETVEKVETTSTDTEKVTDCKGKYVNIALVVDTTGSMSWDIRIVKENLTEFVREIEKSGAISRISLIEYQDIQCDGMDSTKVHTTPEYSVWFDDVEQMVEEIDSLYVSGGGDIPESLVDALGYVVNDEVMTFNDFKEYGSEQEVKLQGKYKQEGRNYVVNDGDIIFFRANTSGLKKK